MTLGKGNHLIKVTPYEPSGNDGSFADRVRIWVWAHPEGEMTERDLAQILCPNESYVIHEVMEDVHYEQINISTQLLDNSASHVKTDLKVIY